MCNVQKGYALKRHSGIYGDKACHRTYPKGVNTRKRLSRARCALNKLFKRRICGESDGRIGTYKNATQEKDVQSATKSRTQDLLGYISKMYLAASSWNRRTIVNWDTKTGGWRH